MANAVKSEKFTVPALVGVVRPTHLIEPATEEGEALSLYFSGAADHPEWTLSETAEDNGTAGDWDLQPGLIYTGTSGMYVQVSIRDFDVLASIFPLAGSPEAGDLGELQVHINSDPVANSDEGLSDELDDSTVEFNLDAHVGPLNENDVIRVVFANVGEEADGDTQLPTAAVINIR